MANDLETPEVSSFKRIITGDLVGLYLLGRLSRELVLELTAQATSLGHDASS